MPRLRPFVKFDKNNQVVPGSLVFSQKIPRPGKWKEISLEGCCDTTTFKTDIPNSIAQQIVCRQVKLTPVITKQIPGLPEATYYECAYDNNKNLSFGQKVTRQLSKAITVCVAQYGGGYLGPYFSYGQGTVLDDGDCFRVINDCQSKECIPCGRTQEICQAGGLLPPVSNCVQTEISADQNVDFVVMYVECGSDEYTTLVIPKGKTSTQVLESTLCRNFALGDVIIVSGDGTITESDPCVINP